MRITIVLKQIIFKESLKDDAKHPLLHFMIFKESLKDDAKHRQVKKFKNKNCYFHFISRVNMQIINKKFRFDFYKILAPCQNQWRKD